MNKLIRTSKMRAVAACVLLVLIAFGGTVLWSQVINGYQTNQARPTLGAPSASGQARVGVVAASGGGGLLTCVFTGGTSCAPVGPSGATGVSGATGPSGATGANGANGATGATGAGSVTSVSTTSPITGGTITT